MFPGELHIGGAGLARGYLQRPELTAEKFIPDPFSETGARLYKTGDLARYRADGNIEFLGRLDHQVKIRGFRIELGEIEAALAAQPAIREAVVLARGEGTERSNWWLTWCPRQAAKRHSAWPSCAAHCGRACPTIWCRRPGCFLPALPLTPNGKVDRKALPEPEREGSVAGSRRPPRRA